jgi:hypothetical protein
MIMIRSNLQFVILALGVWFLAGYTLYAQNGNVGIGTALPTERLHVGFTGAPNDSANFRLDGAFMPNNSPGRVGQILQSEGPHTPPIWVNKPTGGGIGPGRLNYLARWGRPGGNPLFHGIMQDDTTMAGVSQTAIDFTTRTNVLFRAIAGNTTPQRTAIYAEAVDENSISAVGTNPLEVIRSQNLTTAIAIRGISGLPTPTAGAAYSAVVGNVASANTTSLDPDWSDLWFSSGVLGLNQNAQRGHGVVGVSTSLTADLCAGVYGVTVPPPGTTTISATPYQSIPGVLGESVAFGSGVWGINTNTSNSIFGTGVRGTAASGGNFSIGLEGIAASTSEAAAGMTMGAVGFSRSNFDNARGVYGFLRPENTTGGRTSGVFGETPTIGDSSAGVFGQSTGNNRRTMGVYGRSKFGIPVLGFQPQDAGAVKFGGAVWGKTDVVTAGGTEWVAGVLGEARDATTLNYGVRGETNSAAENSAGVYGFTVQADVTTAVHGVVGETKSIAAGGAGVFGLASADGSSKGVIGQVDRQGAGAAGVYGRASSQAGAGPQSGVWGELPAGHDNANSAAVRGVASGSGLGLSITGNSDFNGSLLSNGTLTAAMKGFRIDHPLEPTNKLLLHVCPESNVPLNVYSGNVATDASGNATVNLPDYFMAINKDLRYQLTCVNDFANAIVSEKVKDNRFRIRTDKPNIEVSWVIYGVRNDAWMRANPIAAEVEKTGDERGRYLHPEAFGMPKESGIGYYRSLQVAQGAMPADYRSPAAPLPSNYNELKTGVDNTEYHLKEARAKQEYFDRIDAQLLELKKLKEANKNVDPAVREQYRKLIISGN